MGMESIGSTMTVDLGSSITYIILVLSALGLLLGLLRGFRRGLFRLILTVLSIVIAFFAKGAVVDALLNLEVDGMTILEGIMTGLPAEMLIMEDLLLAVIKTMFGIVAFIVSVLALHFVSWILFGIFKFLVPKGEKKHRLLGAVAGAVGGLVLSLSIVAPINGLMVDFAKLATLEIDGQQLVMLEGSGVDEYVESSTCSAISGIGKIVYDPLTTIETERGKFAISDVFESIGAFAQISESVNDLSDFDIQQCFETGDFESLKEQVALLDEYKDNINEVLLDELLAIVQTAIPEEELGFVLDVKNINFVDEVEILEDIYDFSQGNGDGQISNVVNALDKSTIILQVANASQTVVDIPASYREELTSAIGNLESESNQQAISKLFGLTPYEPAE